MSCERYWREGIVLVERGLADPHRDGCSDCVRAHASRQELIDALPLIGAGCVGDPHWQTKVWQRIDGPAHAPWRWQWQLAGAFTMMCVVALWIGLGRSGDVRPRIEIIDGTVAMRSRDAHADDRLRAAHVDDHLRVPVGQTSDVWIYRADRLVLSCHARESSAGCTPDARGTIADLILSVPGMYRVFVFDVPGTLKPHGGLDDDLAALESANVHYDEYRVTVY